MSNTKLNCCKCGKEFELTERIYTSGDLWQCEDCAIKQMQFHHTQDKISFAVEQLEKVKKWCEDTRTEDEFGYLTIYADEDTTAELNLLNFIDNQIKQLKEGK